MRARIVMSTWGSFGDIHPFIAVALGLISRGHSVTIATSEIYRSKIEGEGIGFHGVRPDLAPFLSQPEMLQRAYDPRRGTEYIVREIVLPYVEQSCEDLMDASAQADLLVSHPLPYTAPLVAERLKLRWISTALQPGAILSTWDPPLLSAAPWLRRLRALGRLPYALVFGALMLRARSWAAPLLELRRKLGLPPAAVHPLTDGIYSPAGTMAWFSPLLAAPQPDWPPRTEITGFPFYDRHAPGDNLDPALARFLDAGEPPIVFTLGSSAVMAAGAFYEQSLAAASLLQRRAVLLTGPDARNRPACKIPENVFAAEYAPYSELLPRAAAAVHQGGIGTTAQALRSGRPMLVVPYSHDQPDNAARVVRLGVARTLSRAQYAAAPAARELDRLLSEPSYASCAAEAGRQIRAEDGVCASCRFIERVLGEEIVQD